MKNLYQIREISVLSFNERVLQEAEDKRNPLMERLRFLGIFSSNMDEFFKVRAASIQRRVELGKKRMADLMEVVGEEAREMDERFRKVYVSITRELAREGVKILTEKEIDGHEEGLSDWLRGYFREKVLPSLVPIILQPRQPFPQLADEAVYLGVKMWAKPPRHAILELPNTLPRFVELPNGSMMYLDDVIRYSLDDIFYIFDYDRIEAFEFKISRDAELDIDNDFSEGYVRKMEKVLKQRKGGRPTRFVHDSAMPAGLKKALLRGLRITDSDTVIPGGRCHNMRDLMGFPNRRSDFEFEKMEPVRHPVLDADHRPIMDIIAEQDILLTYPYQSFDHVIRLLREAAIDPEVKSIRMTLYRVAKTSQVINALVNAARNGKQVHASIELQARFDEENNIAISKMLKEAGALVTYGLPGLKVHSKLLLIDRGNSHITGLSTGNFNEVTGKLYVDSILLTADRRFAREAASMFKLFDRKESAPALTPPKLKHLSVSPFNARQTLNRYINRERRKGKDGYILVKANHLTDEKLVRKLLNAADAGVAVDLVIRTTYAVPPHPNIRAISILDRFLEHQRAYLFGRDEDLQVYMSSADLMERNLDWRVEVAFPVYDEVLKRQVADMMQLQVQDAFKARILDEMQTNRYIGKGTGGSRAQYATYDYLKQLYELSLVLPDAPEQALESDTGAAVEPATTVEPPSATLPGEPPPAVT